MKQVLLHLFYVFQKELTNHLLLFDAILNQWMNDTKGVIY